MVSSSMCSTLLEKTASGDLSVTCTMNCLEVGTVGGGTILAPQKASLSVSFAVQSITQHLEAIFIFPV